MWVLCWRAPFLSTDDEQAKSKLLGCRTAQQMKIELKWRINSKRTSETNQSNRPRYDHTYLARWDWHCRTSEINAYQDVFDEGLGVLGPELHLEINTDSLPVQLPPRKIPKSLRQPLQEHLDELVKLNVVERVDYPTDWVSAIVATKPKMGKSDSA